MIDNAPSDDATATVVAEFEGKLDIHYAVEPRPGLSRARNRALAEPLYGDLVAWLDDDEVADPMWLSELARAFADAPHAVAASGLVVPAELRTRPQVWYEQFGGHSKGRGCTPAEFGPRADRQNPYYPLPAFGVGANMAFRTSVLRRYGFDEALGAGTLTKGGEDTLIFTQLLRDGHTTLYHPSAITRHYHRQDLAGLAAQMGGYGSGLTAYYLALVWERPTTVFALALLVVRALRDVFSPRSLRSSGLGPDFPPELMPLNRKGMLAGPSRYLRQRRADGSLLRRGRPPAR